MFGLRRWIADNGGVQRSGRQGRFAFLRNKAYGQPWTPAALTADQQRSPATPP